MEECKIGTIFTLAVLNWPWKLVMINGLMLLRFVLFWSYAVFKITSVSGIRQNNSYKKTWKGVPLSGKAECIKTSYCSFVHCSHHLDKIRTNPIRKVGSIRISRKKTEVFSRQIQSIWRSFGYFSLLTMKSFSGRLTVYFYAASYYLEIQQNEHAKSCCKPCEGMLFLIMCFTPKEKSTKSLSFHFAWQCKEIKKLNGCSKILVRQSMFYVWDNTLVSMYTSHHHLTYQFYF